MWRSGRPTHALACNAIGFRKGAGDQNIVVPRGEIHAAVVFALGKKFGIGLVDHQQHIFRQTGMQALDLGARQEGADGIVRIVEQHHARPFCDCGEEIVDIGRIVIVLGQHDLGPDLVGEQRVEREGIAGEQHFVARTRKGLHCAVEAFARARAAHDPRRIDAVQRADGFAQLRGVGVRIEVRLVPVGKHLDHPGAAAQRVLVGRQFDQRAAVGSLRLAGHIGMDRFDPRFQGRTVCHLASAP